MMGVKRTHWAAASGTYLVGEVVATRAELERVFGAPEEYGISDGDGKVTTEWVLMSDDGTVATVYDWKRYEQGPPSMDERYRWHVGGRDVGAVFVVTDALGVS